MSEQFAKPFLKWAGGKTQLITDTIKALPKEILEKVHQKKNQQL